MTPYRASAQSAGSSGAFKSPTKHSALIVGNAEHTEDGVSTVVEDVRRVAESLERRGVEVAVQTSLPRREMMRAIEAWKRSLEPGGAGVLYYAGRGVAFDGRNYLIPSGAEIDSDVQVELRGVPLDLVLENGEGGGGYVAIVEACSGDPTSQPAGFVRSLAPSGTALVLVDELGRASSGPVKSDCAYARRFALRLRQAKTTLRAAVEAASSEQEALSGGEGAAWISWNLAREVVLEGVEPCAGGPRDPDGSCLPETPPVPQGATRPGRDKRPVPAQDTHSTAKPFPVREIAIGSGIASLGVAAVATGMVYRKKASLDEQCDGTRCDRDAEDDWRSAGTWADVATVATVSGTVLLAVGLLYPKGESGDEGGIPAVGVGPGSVVGRWRF